MKAFFDDIELYLEESKGRQHQVYEHVNFKQSISSCYAWAMGGSARLCPE